jgi:uncharacterized protein
MKKALMVQGGWDGHEPEKVVTFFAEKLRASGYTVEISPALAAFDDAAALQAYDLIVPCWTMGQLTPEQSQHLCQAVRNGTGLGGFHGGMGDAFRGDLDYEWMVGGHFVGHPYVGPYTVQVCHPTHPIVADLPETFTYDSEQYYLLTDPAIQVLAETSYEHDGRSTRMPVVWTKRWGQGRVFYSALGHQAAEFERYPAVAQMTLNGLHWATRATP